MSLSLSSLNVGDKIFFNMHRSANLRNMRGRKLTEIVEYPSSVLDVDIENEKVLISGMHFHTGKKWIHCNGAGKVLHIRRSSIKKQKA